MEHHGREEMDSKEESPQVWADSAEQEQNTAQVTSAFQSSRFLLRLNWARCGGLASRRSHLTVSYSLETQLSFEERYRHVCGDFRLKLQKVSWANCGSEYTDI